jgi:hypothetical protein
MQQDQDQPVFLGRHGDDEIGMGIGQRPFHLPLAHADAEEPALLDGVGGIAKLGARVDVGRQEPVDPAGEMLGVLIGQTRPPLTMPDDRGDQQHRRPSDEIDHAPGKDDQRRLAEIGLHRQKAHDARSASTKEIRLAGRAPFRSWPPPSARP